MGAGGKEVSSPFPAGTELRGAEAWRPAPTPCDQAHAAETRPCLPNLFTGFLGRPAQCLKLLPPRLAAEDTRVPILLQGGAEPRVGDGLCVPRGDLLSS